VSYAADAPDRSSDAIAGPHVADPWFLAQSDNSVQVLQRYLDAVNGGDVNAASVAFSANAMYHGGGCRPDPCVGQAAIEHEILRAMSTNTNTSLRSVDISGDRLIWSGYQDSDAIRAAGFEHLTTMGTLRIDGDVIVDYRVWLDTTDPLTTLYVDQSEPTYWRAPAAPEPDTKHALD
jgi:hypothetical protein